MNEFLHPTRPDHVLLGPQEDVLPSPLKRVADRRSHSSLLDGLSDIAIDTTPRDVGGQHGLRRDRRGHGSEVGIGPASRHR